GATVFSSTPSIASSHVLGRGLPTFTRPNPSLFAVPPLPVPPAPIPSSNSSTISRCPDEKKREGSEIKFLRPPSHVRPQILPKQVVPLSSRPIKLSPPIEDCTAENEARNHAPVEEQGTKKGPQEIGGQPIEIGPSKDEMVSFLDEDKRMTWYYSETISDKGISAEKIKKTMEELDGDEKERRSEISSQSKLLSLRQRRLNEEEEYLRTEQSNIADICEVLMQEKSPFKKGFNRGVKKDVLVETLVDMMTRGALEPVKVSDWADRVDYNVPYLDNYARGVCKMLPQGIFKIKHGTNMNSSSFVMGDVLSEYAQFSKIVYSNELMAILNVKGEINEKDVYSTLGMNILAHLPMGHSSAFVVQEKVEG
ncbi:hypothetical protein PMAYCL1PPCAC_24793, partial [Pristionchus mayeri]